MRSFTPPTQTTKKTPQCFQDGSFQGTKITFWAEKHEKLVSTINPSLLWVVLGALFPQLFPELQGDKALPSHQATVHLSCLDQGGKAWLGGRGTNPGTLQGGMETHREVLVLSTGCSPHPRCRSSTRLLGTGELLRVRMAFVVRTKRSWLH